MLQLQRAINSNANGENMRYSDSREGVKYFTLKRMFRGHRLKSVKSLKEIFLEATKNLSAHDDRSQYERYMKMMREPAKSSLNISEVSRISHKRSEQLLKLEKSSNKLKPRINVSIMQKFRESGEEDEQKGRYSNDYKEKAKLYYSINAGEKGPNKRILHSYDYKINEALIKKPKTSVLRKILEKSLINSHETHDGLLTREGGVEEITPKLPPLKKSMSKLESIKQQSELPYFQGRQRRITSNFVRKSRKTKFSFLNEKIEGWTVKQFEGEDEQS